MNAAVQAFAASLLLMPGCGTPMDKGGAGGAGAASEGGGADSGVDSNVDDGVGVVVDTNIDSGVDTIVDSDVDTAADSGVDSEEGAPSPWGRLELVAESPSAVATPSTWNPHLPRLAGDGEWLYALHTWYADDLGERYAAILERPAEGGEWAEVARVLYPHQPPGMVVDRDGALHLVFVCMPDGGTDQTCFPGGAGTSGAQPRFYHLVFSGRDESGRLRWNTYTNVNEWPGPTNGYLGLGTTADGLTWWSLADSDWSRVVQWWADVTSHGTVARLSEADRYLLYPIHLAHPDRASADLAMVVGDFDPAGGTNAGYPGATAFRGATSGLGEVWSREDADPVEGAVGVFPGDAALDDDGLHILSYVDEGGCYTELDDAGLLSRLDCLGTYARLLEGEHGRWILAPTAGEGRLRLYWEEEGAWRPVDLELDGELPEGEVLYNFIPAGADASPLLFGDGRHRLLASGMDEEGLSQRSYLVELEGL